MKTRTILMTIVFLAGMAEYALAQFGTEAFLIWPRFAPARVVAHEVVLSEAGIPQLVAIVCRTAQGKIYTTLIEHDEITKVEEGFRQKIQVGTRIIILYRLRDQGRHFKVIGIAPLQLAWGSFFI